MNEQEMNLAEFQRIVKKKYPVSRIEVGNPYPVTVLTTRLSTGQWSWSTKPGKHMNVKVTVCIPQKQYPLPAPLTVPRSWTEGTTYYEVSFRPMTDIESVVAAGGK